MTPVRPMKRLTCAKTKAGESLVVKLTPDGLTVLPKGDRNGRTISWEALYELLGAQLDLDQKWVTSVKVRGVPLVAKPGAFDLSIGEQGSNCYPIHWLAIYEFGARLKANEDAREARHGKAIRNMARR